MVKVNMLEAVEYDAARYIQDFWPLAEATVVKRWGSIGRDIAGIYVSDLRGVVIDTLIKFANDFEGIVRSMGATPTDRRLFWVLLKRQLNWEVLDYIKANGHQRLDLDKLSDPDAFAPADLVRTQLNAHQSPSTLLHEMVDHLPTLNIEVQLAITLRLFEDISQKEVAAIMLGIPVADKGQTVTASQRIRAGGRRMLHFAMNRILDRPLDPLQPSRSVWDGHDHVTRWTQQYYGCGIDNYLAYARAHFRVDAGYMVDLLKVGNGTRVRHLGEDNSRTQALRSAFFTEDQVREIRDQLAHGVGQQEIADRWGVHNSTISQIKTRASYDWVA